ncbi:hypothetical protein VM636_29515 [Streptomyces sp. SCSIO 75703]|uniref:hypothetical protein n=1 Tax=unclassified Streptomyces TaxID=2593676 RepID=UPI0004BFEDFE|nr:MULTISPECIES: hypothetical protein [unclassified Streptomyces]
MAAAHRPDAPPVDDDRPGLRGLSLIAAVAAEGVPADAAADVVYGAREVPAGRRRRLAAAGRPTS